MTSAKPAGVPPVLKAERYLPLKQHMDEYVFEEFVAEFAHGVEGIADARVYGKRGQSQGGLDVIGSTSKGHVLYQAKHVESATVTAKYLRACVEAYARESQSTDRNGPWMEREQPGYRFVVAVPCSVRDKKVWAELADLQAEYDGDLEIALYDVEHFSVRLVDRHDIVRRFFGPPFADSFCGAAGAAPEQEEWRREFAEHAEQLRLRLARLGRAMGNRHLWTGVAGWRDEPGLDVAIEIIPAITDLKVLADSAGSAPFDRLLDTINQVGARVDELREGYEQGLRDGREDWNDLKREKERSDRRRERTASEAHDRAALFSRYERSRLERDFSNDMSNLLLEFRVRDLRQLLQRLTA